MPITLKGHKIPNTGSFVPGIGWTGFKSSGLNWSNRELIGQDFTRVAGAQAGVKGDGSGRRPNGTLVSCNRMVPDGIKQGGTWWHDEGSASRISGSGSPARKKASALIAKIPLPLSRHIAATFRP